ncbi:C45 family autoproteolytic acyltransferase/hydrolase [Nisaea acidiphila]|uniref:C45 family autoproteolytic acyltransferase/hydrolase n=1 Tax=Nisaea acidiphila TaxID=1862145 RepID=A0A9J7AYU7_9PROT|nr:C45 family peptidase [Nisaea acidiphila]UUX50605.1 C45 family autoproteolytic acyltransferase/hydrolase [Nisaea acidiphila]
MEKLFRAVDEPVPGPFSRQAIEESRDFLRGWYAKAERIPPPEECRRRVAATMPEMLPVFDILAEMAGDDPAVIAALAAIDPPPLIPAGCTVRAFTAPRATMLRNYDFHPDATSGTILRTDWAGTRVLGMGEGVSGLLDGVNEHGLAAALTFGGRHVYGRGFGIILIIRYLLQVARDLKDAAEVLRRVPCVWAHNVLVQDSSGRSIRAELAPDRAPLIVEAAAVTNHQAEVEPGESSLWRFETACMLPDDADTAREVFVAGKLCLDDYDGWLGTLYTAEYHPADRAVGFRWGGEVWEQSLDRFEEGSRRIAYDVGAVPRLVA